MMIRFNVALVALVLLPSVTEAQGRPTRGTKAPNWNELGAGQAQVPRITRKDLESFSPVRLMVDKRKDLKLSDEQTKQLQDLMQKEQASNESRYKMVDSLRSAVRTRPGEPAEQERARTQIARQDLLSVIGELRASYDSTFQSSLSHLDETQKKAATDLAQKQREKAEEEVRDKVGGRRGRP